MTWLRPLLTAALLILSASVPAAPRVPTAAALMDWAQNTYPQFFPGRKGDTSAPPYLYRYYPETQNHIGTDGNSVYILGPVSGGRLQKVGDLADFSCSVYPETCGSTATDERSGSYTAYATHGERFTLTLDFSNSVFSWKGLTFPSYASSGSFAPDSVPGTWVFTGGGLTAKFRYADDLVVGSYNFGGTSYPFVAARRFAQSLAEAAGTFNNLGVTRTAANVGDSAIYASTLSTDGVLRICNNNIIYTVALCPETTQQVYTLTLSGETFTATPVPGSTGDTYSFRVAKAGNSKVYLMAAVNATTGARFFRIGVPESATFATGSNYGGTTLGEWGVANYSSTSYSSTGVALDGHVINLSGSMSTLGTNSPAGLRVMASGGGRSFAMRNDQLGVLVGARSGTAAGYMQIGIR